MARWGYERAFTVEHDPTVKKRIDCKDCCNYDRSDRSCTKRPLYLPEDGYNSWRTCDFFDLDSSTSNYEAKLKQLNSMTNKPGKKANVVKTTVQQTANNKNKQLVKPVTKTVTKPVSVVSREGRYILNVPMSSIKVPDKFKSAVPSKEKINEVKKFYSSNGKLDKPVLVRQENDKYVLQDGYVRYYSAKLLGLRQIPVVLDTRAGRKRFALCKKGLAVEHSAYGSGIVEEFSLKHLIVRFEGRSDSHKLDLDYCAEQDMFRIANKKK